MIRVVVCAVTASSFAGRINISKADAPTYEYNVRRIGLSPSLTFSTSSVLNCKGRIFGVSSDRVCYMIVRIFVQFSSAIKEPGKQKCPSQGSKEPGNRPRSGGKMRFYYVNQPKSEKIELRNCGKLKIPGSLLVDEDCISSECTILYTVHTCMYGTGIYHGPVETADI